MHRIAVIPRLSADAQWLSLHVGVEEEAERRQLQPYWRGPSGSQTVQEQVELVREALDSRADGILVMPGSYLGENRVMNQALAKGIPVVVLSEKIALPANPHLYYVLEDSHVTGELIAERLRATVGKGDILLLGLEPDVPGSLDRSNAVESSLRAVAPNIHVMAKLLRAPRGGSQDDTVRKMIVENPRLKAIVALDAGEGMTAAAAVSAAGAKGHVRVIVCDQSIDLLLLLHSGVVDSIVVQQNRRMGAKAIDDIADDRAGRHPVQEVTFDPVLVTAENIDSEPVQRMLLMHRSPPW
ncbi:MAG TPA: substrate-binding domain-containing protein [Acidobacteriaceae bacterium]